MAGWLKRENESSVEESLGAPQKTEVCSDSENENNSDKKLKSLFDEFLVVFLKEVSGISCFRPLPPLIGEGEEVDLFKLHVVVRKRGGYRGVSENGLWSLVAKDCGFELRTGAALKLVYVKYLDTLDRWLRKAVKDQQRAETGAQETYLGFSGLLMELESDLKVFMPDKIKKGEKFVEYKKSALGSGGEDFVELNMDVKSVDKKSSRENREGNVNADEKQCVEKGGCVIDPATEDDPVSRKRKRECYMSMLNWIREVARDPCDPAIGLLPERHKWKYYGSELQWKQILMVREEMLLKRNVDTSPQQSVWQKKQKMHPSLYDNYQCSSERLRCSQRLLSAKDPSRKARERLNLESSSSDCESDDDSADKPSDPTANSAGFWGKHRQKRIPIGTPFQADLPEFCAADYESDSKWLGTKIWPLDKGAQKKSLIERDRIGKGRQEICGCQFPGSPECVRFHVREKRRKVKLELDSAFYRWKFDGMGEDVALSWTKEDEKKFQEIVESNRLSLEKYFWDELFKFFPNKGREVLVSYYFNVFLLRRRGQQNRSSTSKIDSDDEESEFGPIANKFGQIAAKSPGSIFCSPKKSHSNSR
ncbi:AT-rich interactive domain-containing protein 1 [Sesamum indicum]|uniref:AT-rich interactive domain-containing protein 1 n=1 Tax=Sesamum indicum TaxID=4182 RepID=A0A8M8ULD6_SESIN|nr:AT-rich interactive domain-containing protein 1 [Sesamum indicum]